MNFQELTYFLLLCKEKNFSAAAEKLFLTQQGLSKAMKRLETELGVPLFEHGRKTLTLTHFGEEFIPYAKELQEVRARMERRMEQLRIEKQQIRIGFTMGVPLLFSSSHLEQLRQAVSPYTLEITETTDFACEDAVENGTLDFGLTLGPIDSNRFCDYPILSNYFYAVVSVQDPLSNKEQMEFSLLNGRRCILADRQFKCHYQFQDLCQSYGFSADIAETTMETSVIYRRCIENNWIGISSDLPYLKMGYPDVCLIPFRKEEFCWDLRLIHATGRNLSPFEQSIRSSITALFQGNYH